MFQQTLSSSWTMSIDHPPRSGPSLGADHRTAKTPEGTGRSVSGGDKCQEKKEPGRGLGQRRWWLPGAQAAAEEIVGMVEGACAPRRGAVAGGETARAKALGLGRCWEGGALQGAPV